MIIDVSIFLFVFIYVAQFLPSVFADVRSEISLDDQFVKLKPNKHFFTLWFF